jgi:hypothetical protein
MNYTFFIAIRNQATRKVMIATKAARVCRRLSICSALEHKLASTKEKQM